jgi:hypothetical protein
MAESSEPSGGSNPPDDSQGAPHVQERGVEPEAVEAVPTATADEQKPEATQPTTPPAGPAGEPEVQLPPSVAGNVAEDAADDNDGPDTAADAEPSGAQNSDGPGDAPEEAKVSPAGPTPDVEPSIELDNPARATEPAFAPSRIDELEAELRAMRAERTAASVRADKAESALSELRAVRASAADGTSLEELEGMLLASSERAVVAAAKAKEVRFLAPVHMYYCW